jgi:hypothetical protein
MCEYCNDKFKPIKDTSCFDIRIDNYEGFYILDCNYFGFEENDNEEIKINYCPMCGRKL